MLRIAFVLVVVGCLATACKVGGGSEKGEPTVVSEDVFRWSAQQAVNAALITESDLPANYDPVPADPEEKTRTKMFLRLDLTNAPSSTNS